jgi:hypothetical protein
MMLRCAADDTHTIRFLIPRNTTPTMKMLSGRLIGHHPKWRSVTHVTDARTADKTTAT